ALGKPTTARHYYEQALAIRRTIQNKEGLAATLHNLGVLYLDLEQWDNASSHLEEAAQLRKELGAIASLGQTMLHLGRLHEQLHDLPKAVECYEQAYEYATDPQV